MSSDEAPPERPEYVVDAWDAPKSKTVQEQKQSDLEKYDDSLLNPREFPALAGSSKKPKTQEQINKEAIRIRYGRVVKRVPRKRLDLRVLNKTFKCDISYLVDKARGVFFPDEWKTKLLPWANGITYRIIVKSDGVVEEDPNDEYEYTGDASTFMLNCPTDGRADEECLVKWLKEGILDEDKMHRQACETLKTKEESIIQIKQRQKDLPFLQLHDRTPEQEKSERKSLKVFLDAELVRLESERKIQKRTTLQLELDTMALTIKLTKCNENLPMLVCDYSIDIQGVTSDKKLILEETITKKQDWASFRVFRDVFTKGYKYERRFAIVKGAVPDDWDKDKEVNLRGLRIARQKHGQGMYRFGNDGTTIYKGTFKNNKPNGKGELSTPARYFKGDFNEGVNVGVGFTFLPQGTAVHGNHEPVTHHISTNGERLRSLLPGHTKYLAGYPHHVEKDLTSRYEQAAKEENMQSQEEAYKENISGVPCCVQAIVEKYKPARVIFADGSVYEGEMKLGNIHGRGKYISFNGTVLEGFFFNGKLEGPGKRTTKNGYIWEGTFRRGKLHGRGILRHKAIEHIIYEGSFVNDAFEGHGVRTIDCSGDGDYRYSGFYSNGMRDGYGRMLYGDFLICKDEDTRSIFYDYNNVYTGTWQLNRYRMNSMTSTLPSLPDNEDYNYYTTHNLDALKYPWLQSLSQKEEDLESKLKRLKRHMKYRTMEIRSSTSSKANEAFKQKFRMIAVECEFNLQQKDGNRKKYLRKLKQLAENFEKEREEKIASERAVRRDAVIKQMLNAHKNVTKTATLTENDLETLNMKDKVQEIEAANEKKRLEERRKQGQELTAEAKKQAEKLKRININRRRQGLNPVKSLDELKPKNQKSNDKTLSQTEPSIADMRSAIRGGDSKFRHNK